MSGDAATNNGIASQAWIDQVTVGVMPYGRDTALSVLTASGKRVSLGTLGEHLTKWRDTVRLLRDSSGSSRATVSGTERSSGSDGGATTEVELPTGEQNLRGKLDFQVSLVKSLQSTREGLEKELVEAREALQKELEARTQWASDEAQYQFEAEELKKIVNEQAEAMVSLNKTAITHDLASRDIHAAIVDIADLCGMSEDVEEQPDSTLGLLGLIKDWVEATEVSEGIGRGEPIDTLVRRVDLMVPRVQHLEQAGRRGCRVPSGSLQGAQMKVRISITQDDIDKATPHCGTECAAIWALRRTFGADVVDRVTTAYIVFRDGRRKRSAAILKQFCKDFDNGGKVGPISFTVNI